MTNEPPILDPPCQLWGRSPKVMLLNLPRGAWWPREVSEIQLQTDVSADSSVLPAARRTPVQEGPSVWGVTHARVCAGAALMGKGSRSGVPDPCPRPWGHQ